MRMMIVNMLFGVLGGADNPDNSKISVQIGGVQVIMIIDSGASCNVLVFTLLVKYS